MTTHLSFHSGEETLRHVPFAITLTIVTALTLFSGRIAQAGGTVFACTESELRAALAGGGEAQFAGDGTITLGGTISIENDTVLDGRGHQITISGGNAVRVFYVAGNAHFTVLNLTIANGQSSEGAGVFNDGGTLALVGATFLFNTATNGALPGTNAASCGGAICNRGGCVTLSNCVFKGNAAFGSPGDSFYSSGFFGVAGGDGCGAAIYSAASLASRPALLLIILCKAGPAMSVLVQIPYLPQVMQVRVGPAMVEPFTCWAQPEGQIARSLGILPLAVVVAGVEWG